MEKKLDSYLSKLGDFDNQSDSNVVLILSFFLTEKLKNPQITTLDLKSLYMLTNLSVPQNFGGEIRQLLKDKRFIKSKGGYKLSRFAKEQVTSQLGEPRVTSKKWLNLPSLSFQILHPIIKEVSKRLFSDGHYAQAILEAYKAIVNEVKKISGIRNLDGKPLMEKVFSINNPVIKFNDLQSQSDKDEQVGLMLLFSGAVLGIRNPKAHDNIVQKDKIRTLEYLFFASLLLKRLDERM